MSPDSRLLVASKSEFCCNKDKRVGWFVMELMSALGNASKLLSTDVWFKKLRCQSEVVSSPTCRASARRSMVWTQWVSSISEAKGTGFLFWIMLTDPFDGTKRSFGGLQ